MVEFYSLNPKLVMRYQPFMQKRLEKRQEDAHFTGWVNGQYVGAAIGAGFSKNGKYPRKPYYMMEDDIEDEETYVLTDADRFKMFAMSFNASHRKLQPPADNTIIDQSAIEHH